MAGKVLNLSSPKQVRSVLYEGLKLDQKSGTLVGKTSGGVNTRWGRCFPAGTCSLENVTEDDREKTKTLLG